jgi:choline dehydrogenase-like flavoprotein
MLIDAREILSPTEYHCDYCIVGAGVAGIILANELRRTKKGKKIILLEAGGDKYELSSQKLYRAQSYTKWFPDPTGSRLRMLGGSCNIWENSTERLDPIDFEKRPWVPDSGWPIHYSELLRFYPMAEQYCGVGSDGFEIKDVLPDSNIENICQGSSNLLPSIVKRAIPITHFFKKYGKDLIDSEHVEVIKYASLTDIEFNTESSDVEKVIFQYSPNIKNSIKAKNTILCMGGIENARFMLLANEKYNNQLGNKGDNVGRYFMEHPTVRAAHFYPINGKKLPSAYTTGLIQNARNLHFRLKITEQAQRNFEANNLRFYFTPKTREDLSDGISSAHILKDSLSNGRVADNFGEHISHVLGDLDLIIDSFSEDIFDLSITDKDDEFSGYQIISMIEQTPDRNSKIVLGADKDVFNNNFVDIKWILSESDKRQTWKSLEILAQDAGLSAWGRIRLLPEREERIWGSQLGFGQHHIGTTKMSDSGNDGVVDKDCKVFGTKNLYILGSSVFPTGGHVPPTLTIAALSLRLAATL